MKLSLQFKQGSFSSFSNVKIALCTQRPREREFFKFMTSRLTIQCIIAIFSTLQILTKAVDFVEHEIDVRFHNG